MVGNQAAIQIQEIKNIELSDSNTFAAIFGELCFYRCSGVFAEIQSSINFIWGLSQ
jgi:membrane protein